MAISILSIALMLVPLALTVFLTQPYEKNKGVITMIPIRDERPTRRVPQHAGRWTHRLGVESSRWGGG